MLVIIVEHCAQSTTCRQAVKHLFEQVFLYINKAVIMEHPTYGSSPLALTYLVKLVLQIHLFRTCVKICLLTCVISSLTGCVLSRRISCISFTSTRRKYIYKSKHFMPMAIKYISAIEFYCFLQFVGVYSSSFSFNFLFNTFLLFVSLYNMNATVDIYLEKVQICSINSLIKLPAYGLLSRTKISSRGKVKQIMFFCLF